MSASDLRASVVAAVRSRPATASLLAQLAASAASSLRAPSLTQPLPPHMDLENMRTAVRALFPLDASLLETAPEESIRLLHFLLHPDTVAIRKVAVSKWAAGVAGSSKFLPDAVFEIDHGPMRNDYPNALARMKHAEFTKASERFPVRIAYHGTELCNVHNILRESLKNDQKLAGRNGQVFGKGIYLSTEASVAQNFLHYGATHGGPATAVLLECEVVMDPAQALSGDAGHEGVPQKYIVVQNDCLVRVRRLLVYRERSTPRDLRWVGRVLVFLVALLLLAMMLLKNKSSALSRLLVWQSS